MFRPVFLFIPVLFAWHGAACLPSAKSFPSTGLRILLLQTLKGCSLGRPFWAQALGSSMLKCVHEKGTQRGETHFNIRFVGTQMTAGHGRCMLCHRGPARTSGCRHLLIVPSSVSYCYCLTKPRSVLSTGQSWDTTLVMSEATPSP